MTPKLWLTMALALRQLRLKYHTHDISGYIMHLDSSPHLPRLYEE